MWGLSNFFRIMCLKVAESILRCQEGKFLIVYKDTHIKIREIKKKKELVSKGIHVLKLDQKFCYILWQNLGEININLQLSIHMDEKIRGRWRV